MLDYQKGNLVFECDECGEVLETNTSNFAAARNLLLRENWKIKKGDRDWEHYCPQCGD